jgi:membrane protease YdiL (CAAX protease family)
MWSPGIAGIVLHRICSKNLREIGWSSGKLRYWLFACLCPLAVTSCIYGATWWSGDSLFTPDSFLADLRVQLGQPSLTFLQAILWLGTIETGITFLAALGEEIGWRGFLVPLLAKRHSFTAIVWITWAAWYVYHLPIILFGGYHGRVSLPFELIVFGILLFALTVILTWIRLASGSIWPATLFHASHNLLVQSFFDKLTTQNPTGDWITGEFGVGLAFGYLVVALWVFIRALRLSDLRHDEEDDQSTDDR